MYLLFIFCLFYMSICTFALFMDGLSLFSGGSRKKSYFFIGPTPRAEWPHFLEDFFRASKKVIFLSDVTLYYVQYVVSEITKLRVMEICVLLVYNNSFGHNTLNTLYSVPSALMMNEGTFFS